MNAYAHAALLLLLLSSSRADDIPAQVGRQTREVKEPVYEPECMRHGGICLERGKCPPGKLSDVAGLCPMQEDQGIDCCFGISTDKTQCEQGGAICRTDCPDNLRFLGAYGCNAPEVCCALV